LKLNPVLVKLDPAGMLLEKVFKTFDTSLHRRLSEPPMSYFEHKVEASSLVIIRVFWQILRKGYKITKSLCRPPGRVKNVILFKLDALLLKRGKYRKVRWLTEETRKQIMDYHRDNKKNFPRKSNMIYLSLDIGDKSFHGIRDA